MSTSAQNTKTIPLQEVRSISDRKIFWLVAGIELAFATGLALMLWPV